MANDPNRLGMHQVSGTGFTGGSLVAAFSDAGIQAGSANVAKDGTFTIPVGTDSHWTVQSPEGKVDCGTAPATGTTGGQKNANDQYKRGFRDGFKAIKQDCKSKPPQGLTAVDPNYQKGFDAGAALAAKTFCK
ncbi:hypothetical protein ABZW30_44290 [Kitasatospora sp. NPDC004669]|uniref:hypothetical protein n=1 Tax=Kitasatospora sp. NPDC004669 TaxID=3154555 RepID=UPI0033B06E10